MFSVYRGFNIRLLGTFCEDDKGEGIRIIPTSGYKLNDVQDFENLKCRDMNVLLNPLKKFIPCRWVTKSKLTQFANSIFTASYHSCSATG